MAKLKSESAQGKASSNLVLDQVKYRANWQKHQEAQRRREEEKIERERVAYAQIDWHDFVVVEAVDYQPYETGNFPPPTNPDEVGARVLMEERMVEDDGDIEMQIESDEESLPDETTIKLSTMESRLGMSMIHMKRDNNQVQDMDEASSDDEPSSIDVQAAKIQPPVAPLMPPTHDKVVIKKYDPKQIQKPAVPKPIIGDDYLISPITGEKIPAGKVAEHMRIGLLDPRWVEQRDKHTVDKLNQDNVYAVGTAIEASLKQLAERRTDIFGVGDEETVIGKKLGEEETKKDERVTWDGHTSSVEAATRAARANITLEDQIHQIHKVKGLIPDEEKEKIGPKPAGGGGVGGGGGMSGLGGNISGKPTLSAPPQPVIISQAQIIVPPKPPQMVQQQMQPQHHQPQVPVMMMQMRPPPMPMRKCSLSLCALPDAF